MLKMWEDKSIYDTKFLHGLQAAFSRLQEFSLQYIREQADLVKPAEEGEMESEGQYIFSRLVDVETYLRENYKENSENLDKKCKQNGINTKGSYDQIIERMLNLEYFVLKLEHEEMLAEQTAPVPVNPGDWKSLSIQLEAQLVNMRNRIVDIQKLYHHLDPDALDGAPITQEDVDLLDLPKDLLEPSSASPPTTVAMQADGLDGQELLPEENKYLLGHEGEEYVIVELPG